MERRVSTELQTYFPLVDKRPQSYHQSNLAGGFQGQENKFLEISLILSIVQDWLGGSWLTIAFLFQVIFFHLSGPKLLGLQ